MERTLINYMTIDMFAKEVGASSVSIYKRIRLGEMEALIDPELTNGIEQLLIDVKKFPPSEYKKGKAGRKKFVFKYVP